MQEGEAILFTDKIHHFVITKIFSNQSVVIECKERFLSFVRLVTLEEIKQGVAFSSNTNYFLRR